MTSSVRARAGGLLWTATGSAGQAASQLGIMLILARLLAPADFGVAAGATAITALLGIFQFGVGPALVQKRELSENDIRTAFTLSMGLGTLLYSMLAVSSSWMAQFINLPALAEILPWLGVTLVLSGLYSTSEALLQRDLKFRALALIDLAGYLIGYGVIGVLAALGGAGVWALILATISQVALRACLLICLARHSRKLMFDWGSVRALMSFGGGFTVTRSLNTVALQVDKTIVGRMLGADALGIYSRAYQLMSAPAGAASGFLDKFLFPVFSREQDRVDRVRSGYLRALRMNGLVLFPAAGFMALLAPELTTLAFGPGWSGAASAFTLLSLALPLKSADRINASVCRAVGAVWQRAAVQAAYAILIVVGVIAGAGYSVSLVCAVVVLANIGNYGLSVVLCRRLLGFKFREFVGQFGAVIFATSICSVVTAGVASWARASGESELVIVVSAFVATVIVLGGLAVLRPRIFLSQADYEMVRSLIYPTLTKLRLVK